MDKKYNIDQVIKLIGGKIIQKGKLKALVNHLLIDSRRVFSAEDSIFIAVKGDRHDGHDFLHEAYQKGIKTFLVQKKINLDLIPNTWVIEVPDTLLALQNITQKHRANFNVPVIAITGSNGKTIVKEWLYQLLKEETHIVRSPKSYNSQVGVPLSLWQMDQSHEMGIFEAGVSKVGEMGALERMIKPDLGIITNLGRAHDENFEDWDEKAKEKLRLFEHAKAVVYCKDYIPIHNIISNKKRFSEVNLFTWSKKSPANLMIGKIKKTDSSTSIQGVYKNEFLRINIPFTDDASIENGINCWATLLFLEYSNVWIDSRMKVLAPVAMRLELKEGINNCSVINDYYNSDLGSLAIALDFMIQQKQNPNKTIILSDILQTGKSGEDLYEEVAKLLQSKGVQKIIGIGPKIKQQSALFNHTAQFYNSTTDFIKSIDVSTFNNETILLKGARPFGFEEISTLFQKKVHETVLEINLNSIVNNLNFYKSLLKPKTKVMAMVKAFSYGSGSFEIANLLQFNRVDYLAVAFADEGVELRKAGITLPIMVMNPEQQGYDLMIQYHLEPEIYSFRVLNLFEEALQRNGYNEASGFPIHLKLDTGMHRLGFEERDLHELIIRLKNKRKIAVISVFSHLAASDEMHHKQFTREQIDLFNKLSSKIIEHLGGGILKHILNSAGISSFPEDQMDMVRLGIGMYGISPLPDHQEKLELVSELKTTISQIKQISAHDSVGYSRMEKSTRDIRIATVPIGYADGLRRSLGKRKGYMLINGQKAPIVGNVCMDMCMLDITDLDVEEGAEVIVFGKGQSIQQFSKLMDTIPYEALTGISPRVKRIYYQE
jgi:alanine racemase